MKNDAVRISSFACLVLLGFAGRAAAQEATSAYLKMAPVEQYLVANRAEEIALARSAAPESISRDADVLVLGRRGFETAVKGKNGFACYVGRGWSSAADPDYWNPKVRVPMCVNPAGVRTYLLRITKITELALAGKTLEQVNQAIAAAVAKKELPPMEPGAIGYMMGKQGYGGDVAPHWPAHIMFFHSDLDPATWGANLPGSPVVAVTDPGERMTQFVIEVKTWADGTETR